MVLFFCTRTADYIAFNLNNCDDILFTSIFKFRVQVYHGFIFCTRANLFSDDEYSMLERDNLTKGFTLKDKDMQIDFSAELARVDVDNSI